MASSEDIGSSTLRIQTSDRRDFIHVAAGAMAVGASA